MMTTKKYFKSYKEMSKNIKFKSKSELKYKTWCANNCLFLNPMNDISRELFVAHDILQFPNHIVEIGEGPYYPSAFSDIKNKYCKARYLFFCALCKKYPKWCEEDLYLTDTYDEVDFSSNIEYLKIAYKQCFSIFDCIATLINNYFKINSKQATFTSGWIKNNCSKLNNPFIDSLYWLSCDFMDITNKPNWKAPNPDATKLKNIRNSLEHGWVRVSEIYQYIWSRNLDYATTVSKDEFIDLTYKLFKYTRSAILYFTFAVTVNEKMNNIKGVIPSIETPIYNYLNNYE